MAQEPAVAPRPQEPAQQDPAADLQKWGTVLQALDSYQGTGEAGIPQDIQDQIASIGDEQLRLKLTGHAENFILNKNRRAGVTSMWDQAEKAGLIELPAYGAAVDPQRFAAAVTGDQETLHDTARRAAMTARQGNLAGNIFDSVGGAMGLGWKGDYAGTTEDFVLDKFTAGVAQNIRAMATLPGNEKWKEALAEVSDRDLHAMVLEEQYRRVEEYLDEAGFMGVVGFEASAATPDLLAFLATEGAAAGVTGKLVSRSSRKVLASMTRTAPRMAKALGITEKAAAAGKVGWAAWTAGSVAGGAVAGFIDALGGYTRDELQEISDSADPDATRNRIIQQRTTHMAVTWPLYEIIGSAGNKLGQAWRFKAGEDALLGREASTAHRIASLYVSGNVTGLGFSLLPIFEASISPEQRGSAYDLIGMAFSEDVSSDDFWHAVERYAATTVGGAMTPFGMLHVATGLRHAPGMPKRSQEVLDTIVDRVIKEAPAWAKEALVAERARVGELSEQHYRRLVADGVTKDIQSLARDGTSELIDVVPNVSALVEGMGVPTEKVRSAVHRAVEQTEEGGVGVAREVKAGELTKEEAELADMVEKRGPLLDEIRAGVEKGEWSWQDWQNGRVGNLLKSAYHRLLFRQAAAKGNAAANEFYARRAEEGLKGRPEPSGLLGPGPETPAPAQGQLPPGPGQRALPPASGQGRAAGAIPLSGEVLPPARRGGQPPPGPNGRRNLLPGQVAPGQARRMPAQAGGSRYLEKAATAAATSALEQPRHTRARELAAQLGPLNRKIDELIPQVREVVSDLQAREVFKARVAATLGAGHDTTVEHSGQFIEAPEWDNAAATVLGRMLEKWPNAAGHRARAGAIAAQTLIDVHKEAELKNAGPWRAPTEVTEAQILRRVLATLWNSDDGSHIADRIVDRERGRVGNIFERERSKIGVWRKLAENQGTRHTKESLADFVSGKILDEVLADIKTKKEQKAARDKRDVMTLLERSQADLKESMPAQEAQPGEKGESKPGEKGKGKEQEGGPPKPEGEGESKPEGSEKPGAGEAEGPKQERAPTIDEKPKSDAEQITERILGPDTRGDSTVTKEGVTYTPHEYRDGFYNMGFADISAIRTHKDLQDRDGLIEAKVQEIVDNYGTMKLEPLVIAWTKPPDGVEGWYLVQGHHRLEAMRRMGETAVPVIAWTSVEWNKAQATAAGGNVTRDGLRALEQARAVDKQVRLTGSLEAAGKIFNRNAAWAQAMIDVNRLPDGVKDIARAGGFGKDEKQVLNTLAEIGAMARRNPKMGPDQLRAAAAKIAEKHLADKPISMRSFLAKYEAWSNAIPKKDDGGGGFLFQDMAEAHMEALEVIAEAELIDHRARQAKNKAATAVKELQKMPDRTPELVAAKEMVIKEQMEIAAAAARRAQYLRLLLDKVGDFSLKGDEAKKLMEVTDDQQIRDWMEEFAKGGASVEQVEAKQKAAKENPNNEQRPDEPLGGETTVPAPDGPGPRAGDAAAPGREAGGDRARPVDAGPLEPIPGQPRISRLRKGAQLTESDRPGAGWRAVSGKDGADAEFSTLAAATRYAEGLTATTAGAEYRLFPVDPSKPFGTNKVYFRNVETAEKAPVDRIKNDPELEAIKQAARERVAQRKVEEAARPPASLAAGIRQAAQKILVDRSFDAAAANPEKHGLPPLTFTLENNKHRVLLDGIPGEGGSKGQALKEAIQGIVSRPDGGTVFMFHSVGLDAQTLGDLVRMGRRLIEFGIRDPKLWVKELKQLLEDTYGPDGGIDIANAIKYAGEVWQKLREEKPEWAELEPWTEKDAKRVGKPEPREMTPQERKNIPHDEEPNGSLPIDEQIAGVRREEIEDVIAEQMGKLPTYLQDDLVKALPPPTQLLSAKFRAPLMKSQRFLADSFLTALTDGQQKSVLDMSGTGTGKTWTALMLAQELQQRNGGKILFVTSGTTAVESWIKSDFAAMGVNRERIALADEIGEKERDVILVHRHVFRDDRHYPEINQELRRQVADGRIKTIIWDEAHRYKKWVEKSAISVNAVDLMDVAAGAGAKQVFSTATPFANPHEMRFLQSLGIWKNWTDFLRMMGYKVMSAGVDKKGEKLVNLAMPSDPKAQTAMRANLIRLRQALAERGQAYGFHLSYEGVTTAFVGVETDPIQKQRYLKMAEGYRHMQDLLGMLNMKGIQRFAAAWRINATKRLMEEYSMTAAVDMAVKAKERGMRFLFLSQFKARGGKVEIGEEKAEDVEGSLERLYTKKRKTSKGMLSYMDRMLENEATQHLAEDFLRKFQDIDSIVGTIEPTLEGLQAELEQRGFKVRNIHGGVSTKQRSAIMREWAESAEVDAVLGTMQTMGESLSFQDRVGRPIAVFVGSLPWTGPEAIQIMGRTVRLFMETAPFIAFADHGFPTSEGNIGKLKFLLRNMRATIHGSHSTKEELTKAEDPGGYMLTAEGEDRPDADALFEAEHKALQEWAARKRELTKSAGTTSVGDLFKDPALPEVPPEIRAGDVPVPAEEAPIRDLPEMRERPDQDPIETVKRAGSDVVLPKDTAETSPAGGAPEGVYDSAARAQAAQEIIRQVTDPTATMEERQARKMEAERAIKSANEVNLFSDENRQDQPMLPTDEKKPDTGLGGQAGKPKGGGEAGFLDLDALAQLPKRFAGAAWRTAYDVVRPDPLAYNRWEYPPHLDIARGWAMRQLKMRLDDPVNLLGYRIVEPFLVATRDAEYRFTTDARHFRTLWKDFEGAAESKAERRDMERIIVAALNGERYDAERGPHAGRLGRTEEYDRGARDPATLGAEGTAKLDRSPKYVDLVKSPDFPEQGRKLYEFLREKYDETKQMHLSNSPTYRGLMMKKARIATQMLQGRATMEEYKQVLEEAKDFLKEWGVEDYFNHLFTDRKNRRALPFYAKRVMPRSIRNDFLQKGRVSWETGWLEDVPQAFWTYYWSTNRKVHMDRALHAVESLIEGENVEVNLWTLSPKRAAPGGVNPYTKEGKSFETLTPKDQKKEAKFTTDHTRVTWKGEAWDATRGEKDQTTGEHRVTRLRNVARPGETIEFTKEMALREYAETRTGGLRSYGDRLPVLDYFDTWLENALGFREYSIAGKVTDAGVKAIYLAFLGGPNLPAVQLNLLGGSFTGIMRLGVGAYLRGALLAASPTQSGRAARRAAVRSGILSQASDHFLSTMAVSYIRGQHRGPMAPVYAAINAARAVGHYGAAAWMAPFMASESYNRMSSFTAAYDVAKKNGASEADAELAGIRSVGETQFWYEGPNTAMMSWTPGGRAIMQFSSYGVKFFNGWRTDLRHGLRSMKGMVQGSSPDDRQVSSSANLLRGAAAAYIMAQAYGVASKAIQQYWFGDEEAEGNDISYAFGARVRDAWGAETWWMKPAMALEKKTGVDLVNLWLPVMMPFGPPVAPKAGALAVKMGWERAFGDEHSYELASNEFSRLIMPQWLQKALLMEDVGGAGSDVDKKVEEMQEAVRMWQINVLGSEIKPFSGLPTSDDFAALEQFYDRERPYLVRTADGQELYRTTGPASQSRFFLMGTDVRTRRSMDAMQEHGLERDERAAAQSWLHDSYQEWLIDRRTNAEPKEALAARMDQMVQFSKDQGLNFDGDIRRSWARALPLNFAPGGKRAINMAADSVQSIEFLVQAVEANTITFSEFYEAYRVLRGGDNSEFARWASLDPGNRGRLQKALALIGEKRDAQDAKVKEEAPK